MNTAMRKAPQKVLRKKFNRDLEGYLYLAPAIVILVSVFVIPMALSLILSVFDWNYLEAESSMTYVGLQNYISILRDSNDRNSFAVTGVFVVCSVSAQLLLGIVIALLLSSKRRGIGLLRTLIIMPMLISDVVIALCWRFILQTDFGVANVILKYLGMEPQMWTDMKWALPVIIAVDVWQHTSFVILMILAGLQGIPVELGEAAMVDGANYLQRLFKITIPFIMPQILIALIFRTMFAIRVFTGPWVLTGGGPADKTMVLGINIYRQGFRYYEMGRGNALAWLMIVATTAIVLVYINLLSKEEYS